MSRIVVVQFRKQRVEYIENIYDKRDSTVLFTRGPLTPVDRAFKTLTTNTTTGKKVENPKVGIWRFSGPNFFLPLNFFHGIYQINRGWNYTIFGCENDGIPRLELTSFQNSEPKTAKFLPLDFLKIPIRKGSYSDPNFKIPRLGSWRFPTQILKFSRLGSRIGIFNNSGLGF